MNKTHVENVVADITRWHNEHKWLDRFIEEMMAEYALTRDEAKDVRRRLRIRISEGEE